MRERNDEIIGLGGQVAVISFATPEHVRDFADHLGHPFLWFADPGRQSYKSLHLGRSTVRTTLAPHILWQHVKFAVGGRVWRPQQGDLTQLGGDYVFDAAGELTLEHPELRPDDRPPIDQVMDAFRRASGVR